MNKEETIKIKATLPLITDEEIKILDNNFGYITDKVIEAQCRETELALLQLIIKKQQQALKEIRNHIVINDELSKEFLLIKSMPKELKNDILQIIDKVLGGNDE